MCNREEIKVLNNEGGFLKRMALTEFEVPTE
jgi:hypothetical protein